MPRHATRADVLAAVAALPGGRTRFVGIDGCGAAGKTTLAGAVAASLPGGAVVHLDDLQGAGIVEWDWRRLVDQVVAPLLAGRPARYERQAWGESVAYDTAEIAPDSLVVIEGVSATRREANVPWDLTVWVEAPEAVRRSRAEERDGPDAAVLWEQHWIPSENAYVERERPRERVDLVVDGTAPL